MPSQFHIKTDEVPIRGKKRKTALPALSKEERGHLKGIAAALERLKKKQARKSVA